MWLTSTELGGNALDALENITRKADKDHKKKTHLPKMATSLSRTLRNVSEFVIKEGTKLLLQGFRGDKTLYAQWYCANSQNMDILLSSR